MQPAIQPASLRHYNELAHFHYRSGHLAVAERVWRITDRQPTMVGAYAHRRGHDHTVAVLVRTMPHLACRARSWALGDRYRRGPQTELARRVNDDIRTIARVVVRPQWRGRGLARQLVQHALAHADTPITEALAAMGHIHPLFEHAGMKRWQVPPHPAAVELHHQLHRLRINPWELASITHTHHRLRSLPPDQRRELRRHFKRFVSQVGSRRRQTVSSAPWRDLIRRTRARFLATPVYFTHGRPPDEPGPMHD